LSYLLPDSGTKKALGLATLLRKFRWYCAAA